MKVTQKDDDKEEREKTDCARGITPVGKLRRVTICK